VAPQAGGIPFVDLGSQTCAENFAFFGFSGAVVAKLTGGACPANACAAYIIAKLMRRSGPAAYIIAKLYPVNPLPLMLTVQVNARV